MGTREQAADRDFSGIPLDEEVEASLKETAVISMGTEISEMDLENIVALCDQVGSPVLLPTALQSTLQRWGSRKMALTHSSYGFHKEIFCCLPATELKGRVLQRLIPYMAEAAHVRLSQV